MTAPAPPPLDFNNIQGDILLGGLPKKTQTFLFFQINNDRVQTFRKQLTQVLPQITTSAQVARDRTKIDQSKRDTTKTDSDAVLVKISGINISFSQKGLKQLGINDAVGDAPFSAGMLADSGFLGDPGTKSASGAFIPKWDPAFKQDIHAVIMVTGESHASVDNKLSEIGKIFSLGAQNASITEIIRVVGDVRPGKEKGHEHFGFQDGISQPAVKDVDTKTNRGQETIRQGVILLGRDGDTPQRPSWALDGSFLTFRYLSQLVPEFDLFLNEATKNIPGVSPNLLGARLIGRWKSGAPVDVTPTVDDEHLGKNPTRNNDFSYNGVFPNDQSTQDRCPFAAHVRKTNPRTDLANFGGSEIHRIIRSGIAFGPEVSPEETAGKKTKIDRGLLFVAYQSNISNGFQFIQHSWANNTGFPPTKPVAPGFDPIIGQDNPPNGSLQMSGADPNNQGDELLLPTQWVVPKGGEYFFSPSIPALRNTFALAA